MRQGLIKQIAKQYVEKYTCATMADSLTDVVKEQGEANDWLFTKINELHIQKDEFQKAIDQCKIEAAEHGTACWYDARLFSTKFFRG